MTKFFWQGVSKFIAIAFFINVNMRLQRCYSYPIWICVWRRILSIDPYQYYTLRI